MTGTDESASVKIVDLLHDMRFGMLTVHDGRGHLHSRPMTVQEVHDDGGLVFFIDSSSEQAHQIQANPTVNVAFSDSSSWVSVAGTARVVRDQARIQQLWNTWVEAWFPNGPTDPNVALLEVEADTAEYWDSPGGRVATLISLVKAKVKGEHYEGDNAATPMP